MNNLLKRTDIFFRNILRQNAEDAEDMFIPFGIIVLCSCVCFYIVEYILVGSIEIHGNCDYFRYALIVLNVFLITYKKWPNLLKKCIYVYWYMVLIISMPFFDLYFLFENINMPYAHLTFVADTILMFLIINAFSAVFASVIGFILAVIVFGFLNSFGSIDYTKFKAVVPMLLGILIYALLFIYMKEKILRKKRKDMDSFSNIIAQEIRTPLRTIATYAKIVQPTISKLIYNNIKVSTKFPENNDLGLKKIAHNYYQVLTEAPGIITYEVKNLFIIIDMMLINLTVLKNNLWKDLSYISIKDCVESAILRYNFSVREKSLLHFNFSQDFELFGNKTLITHIFFNLFKYALHSIKVEEHGGIYMWLDSSDKYNEVHFKDTSKGASKEEIKKMFSFSNLSESNLSSLGFNFCKEVMKGLGGKVKCFYETNAYTEFVLYFPKK